jgi:hypothetical protein
MIDQVNPFHIPNGDLELGKKNHVKSSTTKKQISSKKKIWERNNTDEAITRTKLIKDIIQSASEDTSERSKINQSKNDKLSDIISGIDKYVASKGGGEDAKESLTDYLAKKREIFLLQLSINIKHEEMKKLHDQAKAKEEVLRNSENLLEQDTKKFDMFLKENDKKRQDLIRLADGETAVRMEREQHLNSLNEKLQVLQTSINKHKLGMDECMRFKAFLEDLTPKEWILDRIEEKRKRQRERRRKCIEVRRENWNKEQQEMIAEEIKKTKDIDTPSKKRKGKFKMGMNNGTEVPIDKMLDLPQMPTFEDEEPISSDEELPMYFSRPEQLLDIFLSLEEENLALIQNTQEAEQSLDEMTERFEESKSEVKMKADASLKSINEIKTSISLKRNIIDALKERAENKDISFIITKQQNLINELDKKVKQVYRACGFKYAGAAPRTLHMLAEIETKMEAIIARLRTIPDAQFQRENKIKEKKRRDAKRAQLQVQQGQLQEERNRKALERSILPPKKVGKKVSFLLIFFSFED